MKNNQKEETCFDEEKLSYAVKRLANSGMCPNKIGLGNFCKTFSNCVDCWDNAIRSLEKEK